jgi:hypothetical protein
MESEGLPADGKPKCSEGLEETMESRPVLLLL